MDYPNIIVKDCSPWIIPQYYQATMQLGAGSYSTVYQLEKITIANFDYTNTIIFTTNQTIRENSVIKMLKVPKDKANPDKLINIKLTQELWEEFTVDYDRKWDLSDEDKKVWRDSWCKVKQRNQYVTHKIQALQTEMYNAAKHEVNIINTINQNQAQVLRLTPSCQYTVSEDEPKIQFDYIAINLAIVMPFKPGKTCKDYFKLQRNNITLNQFITIGSAMLSAVHQLHRHNIIHCDLHDSNFLIEETKQGAIVAHIIDFGWAVKQDASIFASIATSIAAEQENLTPRVDFNFLVYLFNLIIEQAIKQQANNSLEYKAYAILTSFIDKLKTIYSDEQNPCNAINHLYALFQQAQFMQQLITCAYEQGHDDYFKALQWLFTSEFSIQLIIKQHSQFNNNRTSQITVQDWYAITLLYKLKIEYWELLENYYETIKQITDSKLKQGFREQLFTRDFTTKKFNFTTEQEVQELKYCINHYWVFKNQFNPIEEIFFKNPTRSDNEFNRNFQAYIAEAHQTGLELPKKLLAKKFTQVHEELSLLSSRLLLFSTPISNRETYIQYNQTSSPHSVRELHGQYNYK